MKTAQMEKIENAIKKLQSAISELKILYNDSETSLCEMAKILAYARSLDDTDFSRTITD